LRQRLFVFVVVTLLVALGIAAAQGCQGPARGLGDRSVREDVRTERSYAPLPGPLTAEQHRSELNRDG
ncbi:serine/threonine protein kinase, partial [Streptomyces sp. NPDC001215]